MTRRKVSENRGLPLNKAGVLDASVQWVKVNQDQDYKMSNFQKIVLVVLEKVSWDKM